MKRIRQGLAVLAGLAVLVFALAGIANHLAREARLQAEAERLAALAPPPAASPAAPVTDAAGTPAATARDVTPDDATHAAPASEGALVRLPPRLPEAPAAEAEPDVDREVRLRLLSRPVALDVGTIQVGRGTLTLPGIAAPALERTCGEEAGASWPCGRQALTALRAYLRGRAIRCEAPDGFGTAEEALTSACTVGAGEDIGDWLVRNGWAEAAPGGPYAAAEAKAREARLGLWR